MRRLGDFSRTSAPSLLGFGSSGHPLVGRWSSSGEEQVCLLVVGFPLHGSRFESGRLLFDFLFLVKIHANISVKNIL